MRNHEAAWAPLNRPMNLQLFAEPATEPGAEPTGTEPGSEHAQQTPTLTLEDVMRIVQNESDKRVTQALAKQKKEFDKQLSLSGLDEQERKSREKDQRIEELTNSLRQAQVEKNHLELVRTLAARSMPVEFADLIDVGEDLEEAQKRIDALDTAFKKAVEDEVNKRIAGKPPAKGNGKPPEMTREQYRRLSLAEQQSLATRDPDLYKRMNE